MLYKYSLMWSRWTAPEIMLAVLFLVAPLYYHPNIGGTGLYIPNNSTVWLAALIFITYSLKKVIQSSSFNLPVYFAYITAFPILIIVSGFMAGIEQPLEWLFRILFILGGFGFFFSLFQHNWKPWKWDRLLLIVTLSGFMHALVGVMQIWFKADMPYLLPKSPDGIPSGLFQQINNQATFLVTILAISFYLASRPFIKRQFLLIKSVVYSTVFLSSLIIAISGSRVALLAQFVAILVILISRRKQLLRNKAITFTLITLLAIGFTTGTLLGTGKAIDKITAMQSGYSGSSRLGVYAISVELLIDKPMFGHGIGSFQRVFQYKRPDFYGQHPDGTLPMKMVSHPHNEILLWMVEGGISSIIAILLVSIVTILALMRVGKTRAWAYLGLLMPLIIHMQVELPLYMSVLDWMLFLVLLALPFKHFQSVRHNTMTIYAKKLSIFCIWLGAFVLGFFLLHTIRANWDFVDFYKGEQSNNPMPLAKSNPYLSEQAQWIDMSAMLYSSMQYSLDKNVEYFTEWGEKQIRERPDVDLFIKLTDAYAYLHKLGPYCNTAKIGLEIYPRSENLKNKVYFCGK